MFAAKRAYLFGENGKRIVNAKELAERFGVSVGRVRSHMKDWEAEAFEEAKEQSLAIMHVHLDKESIEKDRADAKFLRLQLDILEEEIESCGEHVQFLEDLMESFDWTDKQMNDALQAFKTYLSMTANRKSKLEHYIKVHNKWRDMCGVSDKIATADAYEKEIARAYARDTFARIRDGKGGGKTLKDASPKGFFDV